MTINTDILLVGGGIMSATLATLLHQLQPELSITLIDQLDDIALESSEALNNAGTGHAGNCELNYTPQLADGSISINRALEINANFETSLQFWASLVEKNLLSLGSTFISRVPHLSFVQTPSDIAFLKQRHSAMSQHHLFADMQFSERYAELKTWMPLMMQTRDAQTPMAATCITHGTDVNFGALTRAMVNKLNEQANFSLLTGHQALDLNRGQPAKQGWVLKAKDLKKQQEKEIQATFVFLGAGGGALPLLQKSGIPESKGYGGFPVSGQWLICKNKKIIEQHQAKVYGMAPVGAPPMSVPHLDTRVIDGQRALLFGPYAGFTTKFLKHGSRLDLVKTVQRDNLASLLSAGKQNIALTRYLIKQASLSHEERMDTLRQFLPDAQSKDWTLQNAGQRVQIIKSCPEHGSKLEFGTEIVAAKDGSIAALLGASPGASVSVTAMLDVLHQCFSDQMQSNAWQQKLKALMPAYGQSLIEDKALLESVRTRNHAILL